MRKNNESQVRIIKDILHGVPKDDDRQYALYLFLLEHAKNEEIRSELIDFCFTWKYDIALGKALIASKEYRDMFVKQDENGNTLFHKCAGNKMSYVCVVGMSQCYGAPLIQNKDGDTFLHILVKQKDESACAEIGPLLAPNYKPFGPTIINMCYPEPHLDPKAVEIKNNDGKTVRELYKEQFGQKLPSPPKTLGE